MMTQVPIRFVTLCGCQDTQWLWLDTEKPSPTILRRALTEGPATEVAGGTMDPTKQVYFREFRCTGYDGGVLIYREILHRDRAPQPNQEKPCG